VSLGGSYNLQDHANQIRDAWTLALSTIYGTDTMASCLADTTDYRDVILYDIDPVTGRTSTAAQATFAPNTGGIDNAHLPSEVALAVTLNTGIPGRRNRGRVFLGGLSTSLVDQTTGRCKSARAATIAQAVAKFLQASRDQTGDIDAFRAVVYSRVGQVTSPITRVTVGDVMDVQRRRRASLVEVRQGANVP
jgi:hypothetical protein